MADADVADAPRRIGVNPPRRSRTTPSVAAMTLELIPLCTVTVMLRDPIAVGDGPAGTRLIYEVDGATMQGDRLNGRMIGQASADWLTITGTIATLDVRATFETDDGAIILAQYSGRTDVSQGPGALPIYVAPRFETGDERYAWLNSIQAAGKGALDDLHLVYEWYELR